MVLLLWFVIPAQTIPGYEGELAQSFMPFLAVAVSPVGDDATIRNSSFTPAFAIRRTGDTRLYVRVTPDGRTPGVLQPDLRPAGESLTGIVFASRFRLGFNIGILRVGSSRQPQECSS